MIDIFKFYFFYLNNKKRIFINHFLFFIWIVFTKKLTFLFYFKTILGSLHKSMFLLLDKKSKSIFSGFSSKRWIAFGFLDKNFQFIFSGFASKRWIAFRLYDNKYQCIFSGFASKRWIAFGLCDNPRQSIFSGFASKRWIALGLLSFYVKVSIFT